MKYRVLLFLSIFFTTRMFSQAQFVDKGANAISGGVMAAWSSFSTSAGGTVAATLSGKVDLALSHAVTNYNGTMNGNTTSASLAWLFIRRDSATTYAAFHFGYIWDDALVRGTATSLGLSIGLLPATQMLQSDGVSIQPSIIGALTLPTNGNLIFTYGGELSFLIPIGERTSLVPSIVYSRSHEKSGPAIDNVGIELRYIFVFRR